MTLDDLDCAQFIAALRRAPPELGLVLVKEVLIPEADVALCTFKGLRFNAKFDLIYGLDLYAVDAMDEGMLKQIEDAILGLCR